MSIWRRMSRITLVLESAVVVLTVQGHLAGMGVLGGMVVLSGMGLYAERRVYLDRKKLVVWDPEQGCSSGHGAGCPHRTTKVSG